MKIPFLDNMLKELIQTRINSSTKIKDNSKKTFINQKGQKAKSVIVNISEFGKKEVIKI